MFHHHPAGSEIAVSHLHTFATNCRTMTEPAKLVDSVDPEWENFFQAREQEKESLIRVLGAIPTFSLLSAHELKFLAELVHVRRFRAGEPVVKRGVKQSGFYLVRSGSVHVMRELEDHRQIAFARLCPPELIGEFAILDDSPRTTSVVAAEPSELIGFFKPDLMDIMVTNPSMGCAIILRLAEEMGQSLNKDYQRLRECGYPFAEEREQANDFDPTT